MRVICRQEWPYRLPLLSDTGDAIAYLAITPTRDEVDPHLAALVEVDEAVASEYGETRVQLREAERYEYELEVSDSKRDLRLSCNLATRRQNLRANQCDAGLIETKSFCGSLLFELKSADPLSYRAVASATIDVRSVKLDYRTEYRGMLRRISDVLAGLVVDARSSSKLEFRSSFETRSDDGWLQIQLEMLREILDGADFASAIQRIVAYPHERLFVHKDVVETDKLTRWSPSAVRQFVTGSPRRSLPSEHVLASSYGMISAAARVSLPVHQRTLDTDENRFVKHVLEDFRSFLAHAIQVFESNSAWFVTVSLARRLADTVDRHLSHSLFREIGRMHCVPLSSQVLQRKSGYREMLRWWVRFRTTAEVTWTGGQDIFRAGQRNVAELYEYWLFFELLDWFCRTCCTGSKPPIEKLIDGLGGDAPTLRLKKHLHLGPFVGVYAGQGRRLNATFSYNRQFKVTSVRQKGGSWTRRLHPDYTLTFWPDGLTEEEAEAQELLVHVHFDAKYRVESVEALFGAETEDDADEEDREKTGRYKRQDLLKMHAYRDAIKRSQGAYVLYPGRSAAPTRFTGFHEILPGLGAFAVTPDELGSPQGMGTLEEFLDEVLAHLANRTTAMERATYHLAATYRTKEPPVTYGTLPLAETDALTSQRALPPIEHPVLLAWYERTEELVWMRDSGILVVQVLRESGSIPIPPTMSIARHALLRTHRGLMGDGLYRIRRPGYELRSASSLSSSGYPNAQVGVTYAVFEIEPDAVYSGQRWSPYLLGGKIEKLLELAGDRGPQPGPPDPSWPMVISLQELLKTRIAH